MKTYKVGVIRVLTTEDETVLNRHGKLLERYYPHVSGDLPVHSGAV